MEKQSIQWFANQNQQSPVYDMKWGHFDGVNSTFKMLRSSWNFDTVFKKIRSFDAENLGSVGQRAAKLPAIKLWEWFEGAGVRTRAHWLTGAGAGWQTFLRPPTLTASNFAALWPTEPKFSASKHLIFLKIVSKFQEDRSILKVEFTLSKWPHFIS